MDPKHSVIKGLPYRCQYGYSENRQEQKSAILFIGLLQDQYGTIKDH